MTKNQSASVIHVPWTLTDMEDTCHCPSVQTEGTLGKSLAFVIIPMLVPSVTQAYLERYWDWFWGKSPATLTACVLLQETKSRKKHVAHLKGETGVPEGDKQVKRSKEQWNVAGLLSYLGSFADEHMQVRSIRVPDFEGCSGFYSLKPSR